MIDSVYKPTVVSRDVAKKNDCPKLQLGTLETLCDSEMPALLASITASTNSSRSSPVHATVAGLADAVRAGQFSK